MILVADHAQTDVDRGLPLAEPRRASGAVLQPSRAPEQAAARGQPDRPRRPRLPAAARTAWGRARPRRGADASTCSRGSTCRRLSTCDNGAGPRGRSSRRARRRSCAFAPAPQVADRRGGRWDLDGDLGALACEPIDGRLASDDYPDPLARVWSALAAPHAGDSSSRSHRATSASTGAASPTPAAAATAPCTAGDSLGPLVLCGLDVAEDAREQWALRDVAGLVLQHFGIRHEPRKARRSALPRSAR